MKVSFEDCEEKSKKSLYSLFLYFLSFQRRKIMYLERVDMLVLRSYIGKAGFKEQAELFGGFMFIRV